MRPPPTTVSTQRLERNQRVHRSIPPTIRPRSPVSQSARRIQRLLRAMKNGISGAEGSESERRDGWKNTNREENEPEGKGNRQRNREKSSHDFPSTSELIMPELSLYMYVECTLYVPMHVCMFVCICMNIVSAIVCT